MRLSRQGVTSGVGPSVPRHLEKQRHNALWSAVAWGRGDGPGATAGAGLEAGEAGRRPCPGVRRRSGVSPMTPTLDADLQTSEPECVMPAAVATGSAHSTPAFLGCIPPRSRLLAPRGLTQPWLLFHHQLLASLGARHRALEELPTPQGSCISPRTPQTSHGHTITPSAAHGKAPGPHVSRGMAALGRGHSPSRRACRQPGRIKHTALPLDTGSWCQGRRALQEQLGPGSEESSGWGSEGRGLEQPSGARGCAHLARRSSVLH